jgi:hypothetical protein
MERPGSYQNLNNALKDLNQKNTITDSQINLTKQAINYATDSIAKIDDKLQLKRISDIQMSGAQNRYSGMPPPSTMNVQGEDLDRLATAPQNPMTIEDSLEEEIKQETPVYVQN